MVQDCQCTGERCVTASWYQCVENDNPDDNDGNDVKGHDDYADYGNIDGNDDEGGDEEWRQSMARNISGAWPAEYNCFVPWSIVAVVALYQNA